MATLEFSLILDAKKDQLIKYATDYERLPKYMPHQLQQCKIIENTKDGIITEEIITFKTIINKTIHQQTLHKKFDNELYSIVISGPAKNTEVKVYFETINSQTKVIVHVNLNLNLSMKLLSPLIKKYYKMVFTSFLFRLNTDIIEQINMKQSTDKS